MGAWSEKISKDVSTIVSILDDFHLSGRGGHGAKRIFVIRISFFLEKIKIKVIP